MVCGCDYYIGPSVATSCYGGTYITFMALLNALINNKCDISEICQRITPTTIPDDEYDFVVIGGGTGGSAVAGRLSEELNWKVLLLEAGNDEPPASQVPAFLRTFGGNPQVEYSFKTEPQENACLAYPEQRCTWPRGKVLGGTGVINGMMYMRGVPKDFEGWVALGNEGWSWDDVFEYYKKSEANQDIADGYDADLHGVDGPMAIGKFPNHPELAEDLLVAAEELGYPTVQDINAPPFTGFTIAQTANLKGTRVSSARAYLRPARNQPNLHVMVNSTVSKVILDDTKKISQVEFIYNEQVYRVGVTKEAVISAGAINSPQILLLSGIGPKEELDKVGITQVHDLPGVGKNLHNHVAFYLDFALNNDNNVNDLDYTALTDYLTHRQGPLSSTGMSQFSARLTSKYGDQEGDHPDMQFFFSGHGASCSRTGEPGELLDPENPDSPRIVGISPVALHPKSRGYVSLSTDDARDPPILNPNYLSEEDDVLALIEGVRVAQSFVNSTFLKEKYDIQFVEDVYGDCADTNSYDSDEFWECAIRFATGPENHQGGSCKMGPASDPLAVVDPKLQVHGVEGLRVMDASIMPFMVSGNPFGTIVMIAERGADFIKEKWLI